MDYKFLAERAEYSSRHAGCYSKILAECATAVTDLLARAEAAERERDAAVEDLRKLVPSWEFDESKED